MRTAARVTLALAALAAGIGACSDLRRGPLVSALRDAGSEPAPAAAFDAGEPPRDAAADVADAPSGCVTFSDAGVGGAEVVFNEVQASSPDFVEIYNTSATVTAQLGGLVVADDALGCPKFDEALVFPAGTTLGPLSHLLIRAGMGVSDAGPRTDCLGDAGTCLHMSLGISANGDHLFLVAGKGSDVVLAHVLVPPNATSSSRTYGRLPDGTGPFVATLPTPGAPNAN